MIHRFPRGCGQGRPRLFWNRAQLLPKSLGGSVAFFALTLWWPNWVYVNEAMFASVNESSQFVTGWQQGPFWKTLNVYNLSKIERISHPFGYGVGRSRTRSLLGKRFPKFYFRELMFGGPKFGDEAGCSGNGLSGWKSYGSALIWAHSCWLYSLTWGVRSCGRTLWVLFDGFFVRPVLFRSAQLL